MVQLGDFEALKATLALLLADVLDLVDRLLNAVFGSRDRDDVCVVRRIRLGNLDRRASFHLQILEFNTLAADEVLVMLLWNLEKNEKIVEPQGLQDPF